MILVGVCVIKVTKPIGIAFKNGLIGEDGD